jgi:hypothetical protein
MCIRESVKSTARADAITGVRRSRYLMVGKRLVQRGRGDRVRSITQIAVRRVNCQAGQHRAQQPCDNAGPGCDGAIHVVLTIKPGGPDCQHSGLILTEAKEKPDEIFAILQRLGHTIVAGDYVVILSPWLGG